MMIGHAPSSTRAAPSRGAVLGLDFGTARIGVAVAEFEIGIAHPLKTVVGDDAERRNLALDRMMEEWNPVLFVLGMPGRRNNQEHPLAAQIRALAAELEARYGVPVEFSDESHSSQAASMTLASNGVRGIRQKQFLDSVAAQEILQAYLDGNRAATRR
ncbi:MAG: Holliday junction resolvase RuvX [Betaproteobacteria bacterium]|jgi:putative Holliday junction resolvase